MLKHFQAGRKKSVPEELSYKDICPYTIIIQTGNFYPQQNAVNKWHEGSVFITINPYSEKTESKELEIRGSFASDSEGTVTADFWLPANIKEPKIIKIAIKSKLSKLSRDVLYIRRVTVLYEDARFTFPVKNYLYPYNEIPEKTGNGCLPFLLVREGAGTLLHAEKENFLVQARNKDLEMTRSMLPWNGPDKDERPKLFPGFVKNQDSKQDGYADNFAKKFSSKAGIMALTNLLDDLLGVLPDTFTKVEQYAVFIRQNGDEQGWSKDTVHRALRVATLFDDDEELGREMMCGPNAPQIRLVRSVEGSRWEGGVGVIPDFLLPGKSVEEAVKEGRIFEVTNDCLKGVKHGGKASKMLTGEKQTWYVVPADCMFYVTDDRKLIPILIRLENVADGESQTFWTPPPPGTEKTDHDNLRWMLAKLYFRSADFNTHALCTHYARAHAVNEVFAVAAYRNLANAHPILRLLQPHIQGLIPVQLQARKFLLGKNGMFTKFLSAGDDAKSVLDKFFKDFSYNDLIIPDDFTARGVGSLPNYFYRDDSLEYWAILGSYVTEMVDLSYPTPRDIVEDIELQNFVREVVDEGYRYRGFPDNAGFPRTISTKEVLIQYLTAIIFNISVFHTAVNSEAFIYYSYTPNAPSCVKLAPPKQDEIVTMERIVRTLPVPVISFIAMDMTYHLSAFSLTDKFYLSSSTLSRQGIIGENMAVAPAQVECLRRLTESLRGLKRKIDQRNEGRYLKYDVLNPENVCIATQG